jgi:uncharacterized membrane protein (UPF0127 family)
MSTKLYVELADSISALQKGLSGRKRLAKNDGMLFKSFSKRRMSFWMKDTYMPLDIVFIDDDFVIREIKTMEAMSEKPVLSDGSYSYALETNAGWFKENRIGVGNAVKIAKDSFSFREASGEAPEVALLKSFKEMIPFANQHKLAIVFDYVFPDPKGKRRRYQLVPLERYNVESGVSGDLICGPCAHSNGEYRNFVIDHILNFDLYHTQGPKRGKRVEFFVKDPIDNLPEEIVPQQPQPPEQEVPPEALDQPPADEEPDLDEEIQDLLANFDRLSLEKQSYSADSGQAMMTPYWNYLKKKRDSGSTEGEAVLDYLSKKEEKRGKKKKKRSRSRGR